MKRLLPGLSLLLAACALVPPAGEVAVGHAVGGCTEIAGAIPGPEDIAVDRERRVAFLSATDRRSLTAPEPGRRYGALYRADLRGEIPVLVDVTPEPFRRAGFQPHGIGLWQGGGERRLFVINHQPLGTASEAKGCGHASSVEVFRVTAADELEHLASIASPEYLPDPNDIAAAGPDSFYVTNMHASRSCLGRFAETVFPNRGFVAFHDGERFHRLPAAVPLANGILVDGPRLHVASAGDGTLRTWEGGHPVQGEPVLRATGTRLDNIARDEDGSLFVAAHPDALAYLLHDWGWRDKAPTQILRIADGAAVEIYRKPDEIPAASVAVPVDGRLLVGTIFANPWLCRRE